MLKRKGEVDGCAGQCDRDAEGEKKRKKRNRRRIKGIKSKVQKQSRGIGQENESMTETVQK